MLDERWDSAEEFGQRWALAQTEWWAGFVDTLGRELRDAESHLREAHAILARDGHPADGGPDRRLTSQRSSRSSVGRAKPSRSPRSFGANPPAHDVLVLNMWRGVHGKVLASRGRGEEAEQEVREGLSFAERAGAAA